MKYLLIAAVFALAGCGSTPETKNEVLDIKRFPEKHEYATLQKQVDSIAASVKATIAFAVINIETGDTFSYHGRAHVPMQSTAKFPLALMLMRQVDSGKLSLQQKVHISQAEMDPNTHSPLRDKYHGKAADVTLHEMLYYMITQSDNISCDLFTKMVGGTEKLMAHTQWIGLETFHIVPRADKPTAIDFGRPYENWCEPMDMAQMLRRFYCGLTVTKTSTDTLRNIMERTHGTGRIRGLLPEGTVVAHKTGTSGTIKGITTAVNDIGVITLPNGNHLALAVFVTEVTGDMAAGDAIIARVSKAVWDDALSLKGTTH